ncbi:head-tail connector protein [Amphritea sp. HPY]|uniref:head-tail connector protein n=1 Tax=Amphritea sp. HPY TaxID=3421652 RepID=UPI003D7EBDE6
MPIVTVTSPVEDPITLPDARVQCQMDVDLIDENPLIESLIKAAVDFCEKHTNRPLITQEKQYIGTFSSLVELVPNLLSVETISYIDDAGNPKTLDPSTYHVDIASIVGQVIPLEPWPGVKSNHPQPVTVSFTCGYGDAESVPESIKQCIRLLVGHWFRNREAVGQSSSEIDLSVHSLLQPYKVEQV